MTTTDQIQFLKETSVCQYILVIHTPRLCGEPGFQSARDKTPAAPIHCREMIAEEDMSAGTSHCRLKYSRGVTWSANRFL